MTAEITNLRKYFPPKGPGQFGKVLYEYVVSGVTYKAEEWLSKQEFNRLLNTKRVEILYGPSKPAQSILRSKKKGDRHRLRGQSLRF